MRGLDFVPTPNITHDPGRSYTIIHGVVENHGFERVFISLPPGFSFDPTFYSATGEPVILSIGALRKKYGKPDDRFSFISNNFVFWQRGAFAVSKGSPWTVKWTDGKESVGWYVSPNERLTFTLKMTISPDINEAIIDPLDLEQNRSDIKIMKWEEDFYIYPPTDTPSGFLRAPWVVKNASLVEATPGIYSSLKGYNGSVYYDLHRLETTAPPEPEEEAEELNPPAWNEWFGSGGLFSMRTDSLATMRSKFLPIPEINKTEETAAEPKEEIFIPVWYIGTDFTSQYQFLRYRYEWSRQREIPGIDTSFYETRPFTLTERFEGPLPNLRGESTPTPTFSLDMSAVPEWYAWF